MKYRAYFNKIFPRGAALPGWLRGERRGNCGRIAGGRGCANGVGARPWLTYGIAQAKSGIFELAQ